MINMAVLFTNPFLLILVIGASAAVIAAVLRSGKKSGGMGMSPTPDVNDMLRESRQKISRLSYLANQFDDEELERKIKHICATASEILRNVTRKPELVNDTRYFMNYYIPVLTKIVQSYANLKANKASGSAVADTKDSMDELIAEAEAAFQKQLDALLGGNIIDINAEIAVFKRSMREDGFIAANGPGAASSPDAVNASGDSGGPNAANALEAAGNSDATNA
jgi:hypothetical protein